jgi:hypothetical protein
VLGSPGLALELSAGFISDSHAVFRTGRLAKKAHNGQCQVNAAALVG